MKSLTSSTFAAFVCCFISASAFGTEHVPAGIAANYEFKNPPTREQAIECASNIISQAFKNNPEFDDMKISNVKQTNDVRGYGRVITFKASDEKRNQLKGYAMVNSVVRVITREDFRSAQRVTLHLLTCSILTYHASHDEWLVKVVNKKGKIAVIHYGLRIDSNKIIEKAIETPKILDALRKNS